jgi:hypothetical protein
MGNPIDEKEKAIKIYDFIRNRDMKKVKGIIITIGVAFG